MLRDDTVYTRHSVFVVSEKTLHNSIVNSAFPLIFASPGGCLVEVDAQKVSMRRRDLGLSVGRLAGLVGVSPRTLCGYEHGESRASVSNAYKLAQTLGVAVAKPINELRRTEKQHQCLLKRNKETLEEQKTLGRIFSSLTYCDYSPVHMGPFDFMINLPDENVILGVVAFNLEQLLDERVNEVLSICKVVGAYPILLTNYEKPHSKEIFCVEVGELSEIQSTKNPSYS